MAKTKKLRYKDIPKFSSPGNYRLDVALDYVKPTLDRYVENYKLEMNPDFQRGHVWTEEQQIKFVEFFLSGGYSGKAIYFNCAGWQRNYKGPMVLVDGLQRLTAVLRFCNNEIKAFGQYYEDYDFIDNEVSFLFHVNNLKTKEEVLNWYIQLNEGGIVHSKEEIERVKALLREEKKA